MITVMDERHTVQTYISRATKAQMEAACDRLGMKQVELLSRLMAWFAQQDRTMQQVVLGTLEEEDQEEAVRMVLRRMARTKKTGSD